MVPPDARHLIKHGLQGMAVLDHVQNREVRRHIGEGQRAERESQKSETGERRDASRFHQPAIPRAAAEKRQDGLHQRQPESQDQREMAEFDDHRPAPVEAGAPALGAVGRSLATTAPSFQRPRAFMSSTTSLGI